MDTENEDRAPKTMWEYMQNSAGIVGVTKWIFALIGTPESRRNIRNMRIAVILIAIVNLIQPIAIGYVISGLSTKDFRLVIISMISFIVATFVSRVIQWFHDKQRENMLGIHLGQFDEKLSTLFFGISIGQHSHLGHILAPETISKGKGRAYDLHRTILSEVFPGLLYLGLALVFLWIFSCVAGLIMTVVICIYMYFSLFLNMKTSQDLAPVDKKLRNLYRRQASRWINVARVAICGQEKREVDEMTETYEDALKDDRKFWFWYIDITLVRSFVNMSGMAASVSWGAWLVYEGHMEIGLLYPVMQWTFRISDSLWRLADIEHTLNWNLPAIQSMIAAVSIKSSIVDKPDAVVIDSSKPHRISFESVGHTYPKEKSGDEQQAALVNVSFDIEPGETVSLIGSSGAGKSTIMKHLLRFDDPLNGRITVGGVDLRDITQASWKACIGYIPQKPSVFDGTIRDNLVYGLSAEARASITDEELWTLMRLLKIDFEGRLTNGLNTLVGRNGVKLSGGQEQRLMIGAAVIRKPRLLVVDEATSSLDSTTERAVQEGLDEFLRNSQTSALFVAHRLSTVRGCNKFVVLRPASEVVNGGSQVEAIAYSFEELYQKSPTFKRLADDQGLVITA